MSPRTGRPTDEPKGHQTRIRMSDEDIEKLEYCCKVLGLTRAEVIRIGIERMYRETIVKPKMYASNNFFNRRVQSMSMDERFNEWIKPIAAEWEEQQRKEWFEAVDEEFEKWIDKERERWKDEGLSIEEENRLQAILDEAREDWDEDEQGDFDEWAAEERSRWEEWGKKDEEAFQEYVEREQEKTYEKEEEKFANWMADHYPDWEAEMREKWDKMNEV